MIIYQRTLPSIGKFKALGIIIRNTSFYNRSFSINQRIRDWEDNGIDAERNSFTISQVFQGYRLMRGICTIDLRSQDESHSSIRTSWDRTGCGQVFVAVGIPDLNVVRIIAVEIP